MKLTSKQLISLGYTLASLGGLIVIFNFDMEPGSTIGLSFAILAIVVVLLGIYLIRLGQQQAKSNKNE